MQNDPRTKRRNKTPAKMQKMRRTNAENAFGETQKKNAETKTQISRPAEQQTSRSADQQISRPTDQQISRSADQQISRSADKQISRSADQLTS